MKKTEPFIPLAKAQDILEKEYPHVSKVAVQAAIRRNEIAHNRSSTRPKARIKVQIAVLREYYKSLNHTT